MTVVDDHIAWIRRDIEALLDQLFKLMASTPSDEEVDRLRAEIKYLEELISYYEIRVDVPQATPSVDQHVQRVVNTLRRSELLS